MKIKSGDKVVVTRGKSRGKAGKVVVVLPKYLKIVVEGVNLQKKHRKPRKQGEKGQIVQVPAPFFASNAKLICPKCDKATQVGYSFNEKNEKQRKCKKCGEVIK